MHWVLWNLFVEAQADKRVTVESLHGHEGAMILMEICREYILDGSDCPGLREWNEALLKVPSDKNTNHTVKSEEELSWALLGEANMTMAIMAQRMALRYGYWIKPEDLLFTSEDKMEESCHFIYGTGKWHCELVPS